MIIDLVGARILVARDGIDDEEPEPGAADRRTRTDRPVTMPASAAPRALGNRRRRSPITTAAMAVPKATMLTNGIQPMPNEMMPRTSASVPPGWPLGRRTGAGGIGETWRTPSVETSPVQRLPLW